MWREFDATARQVLFQARQVAAAHGFEFMEDVHLLEGLRRAVRDLPTERPGASGLRERIADTVRDLGLTEAGTEDRPAQRTDPVVRFGESAMRILQAATELAGSLEHGQVSWEHILLALAEGGSDAVRSLLTSAGLTPKSIRELFGDEAQ